jgi:hypothetical protein
LHGLGGYRFGLGPHRRGDLSYRDHHGHPFPS